jgi:phosphatidate cytidylyltransferase
MLERIKTALVLVAIVLSCMFATTSHYPMQALMIIAAGVAGYEWFKLMPKQDASIRPFFVFGYACIALIVSVIALYFMILHCFLDSFHFGVAYQCVLGEKLSRI